MYLMKSITSVTVMPLRLTKANHFVKSPFSLSIWLFCFPFTLDILNIATEIASVSLTSMFMYKTQHLCLFCGTPRRNVLIKTTIHPLIVLKNDNLIQFSMITVS